MVTADLVTYLCDTQCSLCIMSHSWRRGMISLENDPRCGLCCRVSIFNKPLRLLLQSVLYHLAAQSAQTHSYKKNTATSFTIHVFYLTPFSSWLVLLSEDVIGWVLLGTLTKMSLDFDVQSVGWVTIMTYIIIYHVKMAKYKRWLTSSYWVHKVMGS